MHHSHPPPQRATEFEDAQEWRPKSTLAPFFTHPNPSAPIIEDLLEPASGPEMGESDACSSEEDLATTGLGQLEVGLGK